MADLTLSVEEAALALGISRNTAYMLARAGGLPVVRLGRRLLVSRAGLERMLLEAGRETQKAAAR
jgi:excisionase family DNA binding protein